MSTRKKILVVDSDLDSLSRIYLALVHRNYKTEAADKSEEIPERLKRMKPQLIILGKKEYLEVRDMLKIPTVICMEQNEEQDFQLNEISVMMTKPVQIDQLVKHIDYLVY